MVKESKIATGVSPRPQREQGVLSSADTRTYIRPESSQKAEHLKEQVGGMLTAIKQDFLTIQGLDGFISNGQFGMFRRENDPKDLFGAVRYLEGVHDVTSLPPVGELVDNLRSSQLPELDKGEKTAKAIAKKIVDLSQEQSLLGAVLTQSWTHPMRGVSGAIYDRVPDLLPEAQKERLKKTGKDYLQSGQKKRILGDELKVYQAHPDRAVARGIWDEMVSAAGMDRPVDLVTGYREVTDGNKTGEKRAVQHRVDDVNISLLEKPFNEVFNGEEPPELSRDVLVGKAQALFQDRYQANTTAILKDVPLIELSTHITDFATYFYGKVFTPQKEHGTMIDALADYAKAAEWNPLTKKFFFKNQEDAHIKPQEFTQLKGKSAEEIIAASLDSLGIADEDPSFIQQVLTHSAANFRWTGYAKHVDQKFGTDHFKELAAIKFFTDVKLWQENAKQSGWVEKDASSVTVDDVYQHFQSHPLQWMVRQYSGYGDNPFVADQVHGDPMTRVHPLVGALDTEKAYESAARSLVKAGKIPEESSLVEEVLRNEISPMHQLFVAFGVKPDQVQGIYQEYTQNFPQLLSSLGIEYDEQNEKYQAFMSTYDSLTQVDKVRVVNRMILDSLTPDMLKLRYQEQLKYDREGRDVVVARMQEHLESIDPEVEMQKLNARQIKEIRCGDGRTEAVSAALEQASDNIDTVGTAGHFNIIEQDRIREVQKYTPEQKKIIKNFWAEIAKSDTPLSYADITATYQALPLLSSWTQSFKQEALSGSELLNKFQSELKHTIKNPVLLHTFSNASHMGEVLGVYLALDMFTKTFPGLSDARSLLGRWVEKSGKSTITYDIDAPIMPELQERYAALEQAFNNSGDRTIREKLQKVKNKIQAQDDAGAIFTWDRPQIKKLQGKYEASKDYRLFAQMLEIKDKSAIRYKAERVRAFLHGSGVKLDDWADGKDKLFALSGHYSEMNDNHLYKHAYDCGACGGNSGEPSARLMAQWINDPDVKSEVNILGGPNLARVHAVGGGFNTTLSKTTFYPEGLSQDASVQSLYQELIDAHKVADEKGRVIHYSLLHNKPVDQVKPWIATLSTYHRSAALEYQIPEIGHGKERNLVIAPSFMRRGLRLDDPATTFTIGPTNTELLPGEMAHAFTQVYFNIMGAYNESKYNQDKKVYKKQMSYLKIDGTHDILPVEAATMPSQLVAYLPKEMTEYRNMPANRPSVIVGWTTQEQMEEQFANMPQMRDLFDLGYGLLTIYDPKREQWFEYEGEFDKNLLGRESDTPRWIPLEVVPEKAAQPARVERQAEKTVFELDSDLR